MIRSTIYILIFGVASASYSQSAFLKRGTSAIGAAVAYGTDADAYSLGGSVSLAINGKWDVGYSYSGITLDDDNTVSSQAIAVSVLTSRGDDKSHRLFLSLNYALVFTAFTYTGKGLDPYGQPARDYDGPKSRSHLVGVSVGNLPPIERRPAFVWSLDVTRTFPTAVANQYSAPKGVFIFGYSLGLAIPIATSHLIVPIAGISRDNKTTSFTFATQLVFALSD